MREPVHPQASEHAEFIELCALYTSGSLRDAELKRLDEHLEVCSECRKLLQQFQQVGSMGLPALAPEFAEKPSLGERNSAADRTGRKLLARIENEILARQAASRPGRRIDSTSIPSAKVAFGEKPARRFHEAFGMARALLPFAATVLLMASVGLYSYRVGARKVANVSAGELNRAETRVNSLETRITDLTGELSQERKALNDLSQERQALNAKLDEGGRTISALSEKIRLQQDQIASLEEERKKLADAAQSAEQGKLASDSERDAVNRRLTDAQASLAAMQRNLDAAHGEQTHDLLRAKDLEKRLDELSTALRDRDQTVQQQRDLLAYDRDIRDLIGARDLYVAEVTDVGRDGETKTPFGRVFFTKGKSLIFYAYDLDKQPGVRHASVFQAWGRRGPDFEQALPLGILYLDASSNKRWVLKFDDPKALAKVDAVFVTVEPRIGSQKPSGKPVLFAYLKVEPNHP